MKKNNNKIICFDIDNTICHTIGRNYNQATPNKNVINKINELYKKGHIIKLFTILIFSFIICFFSHYQ